MRDSRLVLIGLALVAITVGGAAPWRTLPQCVIGKWTGITETDPVGNIIGPADPDDWGCLGGAAGGVGTAQPTDVPPIPTGTCLQPAHPNPTSAATRLAFTLPRQSHVTLAVYAKKGHGPHNAFLVRTLLDASLAAGFHTVIWDGNDDQGVRVAPDIYRVAMVVGSGTVCGDIEIR